MKIILQVSCIRQLHYCIINMWGEREVNMNIETSIVDPDITNQEFNIPQHEILYVCIIIDNKIYILSV